ncbi:hypothetical protein ACQP3F_34215, partial [Escherichia coli]
AFRLLESLISCIFPVCVPEAQKQNKTKQKTKNHLHCSLFAGRPDTELTLAEECICSTFNCGLTHRVT